MENSIFNVGTDGYNAYLVKDGVLIDGVPSDYADEFVKNIEKHTSVSEIEYIVFTHAPPDRAGTLEKLLKIYVLIKKWKLIINYQIQCFVML